MFNSHRHKALLYLKATVTRSSTTTSPKVCPLLQQQQHLPSSSSPPPPFSLPYFSTSTSDKHPFAVSYLIKNCELSLEAALKASKRLCFTTSQELDSVLTFFRNWGFSDSQIHNVVVEKQSLLSCNVDKIVRPKFEFLQCKGASNSDIVLMVTSYPRILHASLDNKLISAYGLLNRFVHSSEKTIACIIKCPVLLCDGRLAFNIKMLLENGVTESNVTNLLRLRAIVLCSGNLRKAVEEVKDLGFNPSKSSFNYALVAVCVSKSKWDEKIGAYKSWGLSEETILEAFRKQPGFVLISKDRINAFMGFWVNQLGWNSLAVVNGPALLGYSLQKRIIPRAAVIQFLLSQGLRSKDGSLIKPFLVSEKMFLEKYVTCFAEEASQLLKLYEEKMNCVP